MRLAVCSSHIVFANQHKVMVFLCNLCPFMLLFLICRSSLLIIWLHVTLAIALLLFFYIEYYASICL